VLQKYNNKSVDVSTQNLYNYYIQTHKGTKMNEFKSWEEMSTLEQYACQYWDMYKDAYGVRPRGIDTSSWTEEQFEAEFVSLSETIDANYKQQLALEAVNQHDFEMRMLSLLQTGAKTREMALRWIHEAEGTQGDDEYLCYTLGLPYRYFAVDRSAV
jgi:hypothetical protein